MDPTSFRFLLTMPGDERLVGAIRELATHAGVYAKLPSEEAGAFVERVASAAESLIADLSARDVPLEFRFFRSPDLLRVTITCRTNGSEVQREVEQRTSA